VYGVVQAVGFLGDTTGNQSYSGLDAQRAARVAVRLDSGFAAYPKIDPVIVADVTSNGQLSGLDAQRIALEAVGIGADEIPDLPQALRLAAGARRVRSAHAPPASDSGAQSAPYGLHSTQLGYEQLAPLVDTAVARIEAVDPDAAAKLQNVAFEIVDLPDNLLGLAVGDTIHIDVNAAGYGWFVEKYEVRSTKDEVGLANPQSVDLLTVVTHELGHVLGLDHHESGVMDDMLPLGAKRLPGDEFGSLFTEAEIDAVGDPPARYIEAIDEVFSNEV